MMLTPEQLAKWRRAVNNLLWSTTISSSQLEAFLNHIDAQQARITGLEQDAARYRWLRDSTKCEAPGDFLNIDFEKMDAAIDAAMQSTWPEDASDYSSRIAAIGQNGNDGLHYPEQEGGK